MDSKHLIYRINIQISIVVLIFLVAISNLEGQDLYRFWGDGQVSDGKSDEVSVFNLYNFQFRSSVNTALPRGYNDGAWWQGRGMNSAYAFGVYGSLGPINYSFRPEWGVNTNTAFDLGLGIDQREPNVISGRRAFVYRSYLPFSMQSDWVNFDRLWTWFDWGHSFVELELGPITAGVGNQQILAGPAQEFSVLYGRHAPGFWKTYVQTNKPIDLYAFKIDAMLFYGKLLPEADIFSRGTIQNSLAGAIVKIYPKWLSGLMVGVHRSYLDIYPATFKDAWRQFIKVIEPPLKKGLATQDNPEGNDPDDQYLGFFASYDLSPSLQVYGEIVRSDHSWDFRDLRMQPMHMGVYNFGVDVCFNKNQRLKRLNVEWTNLNVPRAAQTRNGGTLSGFYTHSRRSGFLHRGQIMGSTMGPGSQAVHIQLDWVSKSKNFHSIYIRRFNLHDDMLDGQSTFYNQIASNQQVDSRTDLRIVEWVMGYEQQRMLTKRIEMVARVEGSIISNQFFVKGKDVWNLYTLLEFRYRFNAKTQ